LPFKEAALQMADRATEAARAAGAANLLLFAADGGVEADNTDGEGLLYALRRGDPGLDPRRASIAVLGAGGAARGALAALTGLGAQDLRVINRTPARAERLAAEFPSTRAFALDKASEGLSDAALVINAASAEVEGEPIPLDFSTAAPGACAMDMRAAAMAGLRRIDGLDMLIGQALPSFERLFGRAAPSGVDARGLALRALGEAS
jgi:shikimate dehydrogenase